MKKLLILATLLLMAGSAHAQWSTKWLAVGRLHHPYFSGGGEPEDRASMMNWPGIRPDVSWEHNKGLWISAKDWKSETGQTVAYKNSHLGPRVLGLGEMFDMSHKLISRFDVPLVKVDGLETFNRPTFVDEVITAPSTAADRYIETLINTSVGVSVVRKPMQWSQELHDSYHIVEYTFTNTGNTDDDDGIEIPDQVLNDVYFTFLNRPKQAAGSGAWDNTSGGVSWGQFTMTDAIGDGEHDTQLELGPNADPTWRAQYSWMGYAKAQTAYSEQGAPMWKNHQWNSVADDTLGRLGAAAHTGQLVLCSDGAAHAANDQCTDDPAQPHTMTYLDSDWSAMTANSDHNNIANNTFERGWIENGSTPTMTVADGTDPRTTPSQAYLVESAGKFFDGFLNPSDRGRAGGYGTSLSFGPYDMQPGQQVKIVLVDAIAGLSDSAAWKIGREYKQSAPIGGKVNEDLQIFYDANMNGVEDPGERKTKNQWVASTRDSLFNLFKRAEANYESGYTYVQSPPTPPKEFEVISGTDKITLRWVAGDAAAGAPIQRYEVWRAQKAYHGIITALRVVDGKGVPDWARAYKMVHTIPNPSGTEFTWEDNTVNRGESYYYYVQAVGGTVTDAVTGVPVELRSSRYYTQTYEPAYLRRPPIVGDLSKMRIVPNPFTMNSEPNLRFDERDRMAFFGLPAAATIKIYTELGELVNTIEHTDGSGDDFWDMTTYSRQLVVSGIYLAVITDKTEGEHFGKQVIRKIIIVR